MSGSLYPSLNRYFENNTQLAHAGCMSRTRLWECLTGQKKFTRAEKKAISAGIAMKLMTSQNFEYSELERAVRAWKGGFDEEYKVKENE